MALDLAQFQLLFPEFSSSAYDARITTLLGILPPLDEDRAGNQLPLAHGNWIADQLATQDFAIKYGVGSALASSSSLEKTVGKVIIKTSQSQSNTTGKGARKTFYAERWEQYLHEFGWGAQAV
jgi:hypothetical protein